MITEEKCKQKQIPERNRENIVEPIPVIANNNRTNSSNIGWEFYQNLMKTTGKRIVRNMISFLQLFFCWFLCQRSSSRKIPTIVTSKLESLLKPLHSGSLDTITQKNDRTFWKNHFRLRSKPSIFERFHQNNCDKKNEYRCLIAIFEVFHKRETCWKR